MGNLTQSIQNTAKTANASNKTVKKNENPALAAGFENLFASAMQSANPQAKLNTIQQELREALASPSTPKKNKANSENETSASDNQTNQTAIWAQRDWMNQQNATPTPSEQPKTNTQTTSTAPQDRAEEIKSERAAPAQTQDAPEQLNKPAQQQAYEGQQASRTDTSQESLKTAGQVELQGMTPIDPNNPQDIQLAQDVLKSIPSAPNNPGSIQPSLDPTLAATTGSAKTSSRLAVQMEPVQQGNTPQTDSVTNTTKPDFSSNPSATAALQMVQQKVNIEEFGQRKMAAGDQILATAGTSSTANNPLAMPGGMPNALPTGRVAQATINTPVNQPGFVKELNQQINWAIGKNMSTVDIRVNPESFGGLNMRIVQKGQQIQIVIRTQDEASATLLNQALHGLKETMAQSGLQLSQVQIHSNQGNAQSAQTQTGDPRQQGDQAGQQQRQPGHQTSGSNQASDETAALANPVKTRINNSGLDLFA